MFVSAHLHGEYDEILDVIVSGEAYEIQVSGERASAIRSLVEMAMNLDLIDVGETGLSSYGLARRVADEVADFIADR